jgi:hypothetical protein
MGCNLLGRGIGVNRLKRGGSLFEGIVQKEMEEYIVLTRCARSGLPSFGGIPNLRGVAANHEEFYMDTQERQNT